MNTDKIKEDLTRKREARLAAEAAARGERPPANHEQQRTAPLTAEKARRFGIAEESIPFDTVAQPFLKRRDVQKGPREINVSVFPSAKGGFPTASTLASIVEGIRTGRRAEQIENLRTLLKNEGKQAYDREKTNLAAFTMSASCSDRKTLLAHNGLIQADLDNLNGTLLAVRERMKSDPHVVAGFVSPSGKGLKIAFRVPANPERHRESFEAVSCYVREKYGEKIDPACKDPLRLCFISSDPEAWLNEDAIELNVDAWRPIPTKPEPAQGPLEGFIILPSGSLQLLESAQRAFRILASSETLFLRGGRVCELVCDDDGLLKLDVVDEQTFRSRIEKHSKVMAYRTGPHGEELLTANARCSLDTAKAWLASEAREILPPIAAIHNCPLMVEDNGQVEILGKGYHRICGGRLIAGGDTPQQMELGEATSALLDILSEFYFATPADKSRAIASLLSPAMKFAGLLGTHVPLFVVEADDSQAGKGFFLELVQTIYRETPSLVTQRTGGVGGFDESLAQAMLDARPFIQLDNVRGRIGSPYFETVLTCPPSATVPARVPYKGNVQVRPERFTFQLTSNGFESTRDLANRSCIVRLRKRHGFSFRRYPQGGLLEHVAADQPRYLGAVYCVVVQWIAHGKKASDDTRGEGRFRRWAQIMDWIVQELFALPPLMDGHEAAQERAGDPALNWLRQVCLAVESDARLDETVTASDIMETCQEHSIEIPGIGGDEAEPKARMRVGQILSKVFKERDAIECDDFAIRRTETIQHNKERRRDETLRKYTIGRFAHRCASSA
jgi:BT4734-like, N-terminal domain